jgi:O-antigen ligase
LNSAPVKAALLLAGVCIGVVVAGEKWLYLGAIMGMGLFIVRPVHVGLGLFAFLVPFDGVMALGSNQEGMTLTAVVGLGTVFVILAVGLALDRLELPSWPAFYWFVFVSWAGTSILWSYNPEAVVHQLPTILGLFFFYLVVTSYCISEGELSSFVWLTILGGCAAAVVAIYFFRNGVFFHGLKLRGSLIFFGREANPDIFAATLLLPLSLAIGEFMVRRRAREKVLLFLLGGAISLGILVTTSRGSIIAMSVMVLFYIAALRMNWRALVPAVILAGALLLVPSFLFVRLQQSETSAGAGRLYIWQTGLVALKDHFLVGAGLDNFQSIYNDYAGHARGYAGLSRAAHNDYLQTAIDLGVVGLALFGLAIWSHLRLAKRANKSALGRNRFRVIACQAAAWGMLAAAFFAGLSSNKAFWLIWVMLVLVSRPYRTEAEVGGADALSFEDAVKVQHRDVKLSDLGGRQLVARGCSDVRERASGKCESGDATGARPNATLHVECR